MRKTTLVLLGIAVVIGASFTLMQMAPLGETSDPEPQALESSAKPAGVPADFEPDLASYKAFVDQFTAANGEVALRLAGGSAAPMPFAAEAHQFEINGETINLYIFDNPAVRDQISERIAPDGSSYGEIDPAGNLVVTQFELTDYPLFWEWEQFLIYYMGHDGTIIDQLTNAFGSHFAGGAFYASALEMLMAHEWVLVDWGTPEQITTALPNITRVRFSDGQMSGNTGVNDFGVPYVIDENEPAINFRLSLDEFIMTESLSDNPAVNEQERVFIQALRSAHHIAVSPGLMKIGYGDGLSLGFTVAVTIPLEATQIILSDGHPDFPLNTAWVVNRDGSSPIEVPIPLAIPEGWQGRYAVRIVDNSAYYDFTAGATESAPIFSITALTEQGWQAIQGEPHGEAIFTYGGIVWVYNPALENPYDGELADAFSQMVGEAYDVAYSLPAYFTPVVNPETTLPVLQTYLAALAGGQFGEATLLYGGDYSLLEAYNPDIAPDDSAGLLEAACTINGFICDLTVHEIVRSEQLSDQAVQFTVTLAKPDGSLFELGPCCGTDSTTTAVQREFTFTVTLQNGRFQVMELPVYGS